METFTDSADQPISRRSIYYSKVAVATLLLAVSMVVLGVGSWISGLILSQLRPDIGFVGPFPLLSWSKLSLATVLCSGLLIAIHTWISLRFQSFVFGLVTGFLGLGVAGLLAVQDMWPYFPWRLPISLSKSFSTGIYSADLLSVGALGGLAITLVAGWEVMRRDVF